MQQRPRRRLTPAQRKKLRRKRWMQKNLKYCIFIGILAIAVIILILLLTGRKGSNDSTHVAASAVSPTIEPAAVENDTDDMSQDPIDTSMFEFTADSESDGSISVTAAPINSAPGRRVPSGSFEYESAYIAALNGEVTGPVITPDYSKIDPAYRNRWPETEENRIPVLNFGANITDKVICITVDDCYQGENLRQIVQCALDNSARLTIFPIGENLEKSNIAEVVKWAWESGMEIENHTYTHNGLYHFDDDRMRNEIWGQNRRLEQVLGVNYTEHFFRPHGGDERNDQRVHAYLDQLGFVGIAHWTQSGSSDSWENLVNKLAPGNIYLFHTPDKDLGTLKKFIPYCVQQGYKLITLNEMFGLPENETSPLTTSVTDPAPEFASFKVTPVSLKKTTYARAATVVQRRLIELGWMDGEADGEFGKASYMATGFFQLASGIQANGVASVETQIALFSPDAERGSPARISELSAGLKK